MARPLRSLLIGDVDFYPSEFIFLVAQGMALLGHWHATVNTRQPLEVIARRLSVVQPDVIWGHMLLWSSPDRTRTLDLLELMVDARRRYGTRVLLHDGDARVETRWPEDISDAVDLALCNHTADRSVWNVPQLRWSYGAFTQHEMAAPVQEFRCRLAFAGRVTALGGGMYGARSALVERCKRWLGEDMKIFPGTEGAHTLFRTPELAASADAVLGFGRPESPGWTDVRVFQYPGAGGVLLHDDVQGFLEPGVHYVPLPCDSDEVDVRSAVRRARLDGPKIRTVAFEYVQRVHSSVPRVRAALAAVGLAKEGDR